MWLVNHMTSTWRIHSLRGSLPLPMASSTQSSPCCGWLERGLHPLLVNTYWKGLGGLEKFSLQLFNIHSCMNCGSFVLLSCFKPTSYCKDSGMHEKKCKGPTIHPSVDAQKLQVGVQAPFFFVNTAPIAAVRDSINIYSIPQNEI